MNPRCAPQRIGGGYLLDQSAEFCGCAGRPRRCRCGLDNPGPEFAEPFALPTDDGVCLDIKQGMSPIGPPHCGERPKISDQRSSAEALPFSLKRCYPHSKRCVLDRNGLMSAEEQADESKHEQ
jgi:hypothetical protein